MNNMGCISLEAENSRLRVERQNARDALDAVRTEQDLMRERLDKANADAMDVKAAFALACRFLSDQVTECPAAIDDAYRTEACDGEADSCGDVGLWECWQDYFMQRATTEDVCLVCGCTDDNACPGGCFWAEPGLCSKCVGKRKEKHGENQ